MTHLPAYPGTQSTRRALALLKAFRGSPGASSLTQLARRVRLNKSTAFRLLTALELEGLVTKEAESGGYRLGPETIALGWQAVQANEFVPTVRPHLVALARQTRESATLEILAEGQVLILDEVTAGRRVEIGPSVGSRWPVHATSTGKILLAHLPESELGKSLPRRLRRFTKRTLTTRRELRQELAQVRRQGFAMAREELEAGFVALAAPIFRHDGLVVAAISIGGPTVRIPAARLPEFAARVQWHARRASRALGYRPPRRVVSDSRLPTSDSRKSSASSLLRGQSRPSRRRPSAHGGRGRPLDGEGQP